MKTPFVVLALAAASQAVRVPLCSAICMTNAIAATGCSASDTACICTSEKFFPVVAQCAEQDCNADKSVVDTAEGFCANAGIHVEVKRWGGGGGPYHGHEGHEFGPGREGHEFGRGRWGKGRWKGGKKGGFRGWWGGEEGSKGSSPAPAAPAAPAPGGSTDKSSGSPPKEETSGEWEDWSGGHQQGWGGRRPQWGNGKGNPWEPHQPTSPDHHPHPTGPWEPPSTVI